MDALSLIRSAGLDAHLRRSCFFRFLCIVLILLHPAIVASAEVDIPDRPADYLMDRGEVLLPEKAREISAALNACARDYDIHIYIMTLPTLGVMPSRAREKLDNILETAKSKWMPGKAGAVVIFDYETGGASMAESEETRRVFSPVSINLIFEDPQLQYMRKIRPSDQLERAATTFIKHFSRLRQQASEESRRRRMDKLVFGGITGGALFIVLLIAVAKRRFPPPSVQAPLAAPLVTVDK